MEWFSLFQDNTVYRICISIDIENNIDIFVRDRFFRLYHGRSVKTDYKNLQMSLLLDTFKRQVKGEYRGWTTVPVGVHLSFSHDVGFMAVGNLKDPEHCCCIGIDLVKKENLISKMYTANEELMAVIALVNLRSACC